ncbi:enoyl-CoA hydratase/carnithine racemase [Salirhabdus euzebyi]|uniref:Enoyl-CoA hydratase/carnithine racemase n=1 Tax=Salirhabdus euzebyi TaxID=394506 RepID=A0A841Q371_9BACI|nr:enoyl-CoA hydratase [Salirhabdus euzebyi]MBB6452788.1 enoyl-CoA hydratase/carnithine racemase [Salirhabdus euzebyi]
MSTVQLEIIHEHIGLLTLNRPEAANSFSLQLLHDLNNALDEVEKNNQIRVLILTGSGEKAFCAGADLKEREGMTEEQVIATVGKIKSTTTRVEQIAIPTIAAINGAAFGGGLELALACDIRIACDTAKMGLTETSLGIIPGAGGTQRLSRLIGLGKAKYLIFTAKRLTSKEAKDIGLVEEVLEKEDFLEKSITISLSIAQNGPIGIQQAKKAINLGYETDITSGLKIEDLCYAKTIPTVDRREGLLAFKEKRKPQYKGK